MVRFALIACIVIAGVAAANAVAGDRGEVLQFKHTNFGAVAVGDQDCRTLVVTNVSDMTVFGAAGGGLGGAFGDSNIWSWFGATFFDGTPNLCGNEWTCPTTGGPEELAPRESCRIAIAFRPLAAQEYATQACLPYSFTSSLSPADGVGCATLRGRGR
jgi:hypothetical protein